MGSGYGEVPYTLSGLEISSFNAITEARGTPVAIVDGQIMEVTPQADTDEMRGYGAVTRLLTVPTMNDLRISHGGLQLTALQIFLGVSTESSGSTPNAKKKQKWPGGGAGLPYFSAIGKAPAEGGGDATIGLPKCKLNAAPTWTFDGNTNQYITSEMEGRSAVDQAGILQYVVLHETDEAIDFTQVFTTEFQ